MRPRCHQQNSLQPLIVVNDEELKEMNHMQISDSKVLAIITNKITIVVCVKETSWKRRGRTSFHL